MSPQAASDVESPVASELQRVGVKVFLEGQKAFDGTRMIGMFHRWIQEDRLPGTLIDVHDYTHVPGGPGVLLVAHEWHLRTDEAGGRVGLEFELKREGSRSLVERVREAIVRVFGAAAALEEDTADDDPVRFGVRELAFRFTDRLAVPATDAAFDQLAVELESLLGEFYGEAAFEFERVGHERGPLTIHVRVVGDGDWGLEELIAGARTVAG
jgi:hypothetical protein